MYGITEEHNADRRGGQALQNLCGRYVVSYIKQMNGMAQNKDIAIALYGRKTAEDGVAYLFAYGSAKLNFLQKPVRHCPRRRNRRLRSCGESIFRK